MIPPHQRSDSTDGAIEWRYCIDGKGYYDGFGWLVLLSGDGEPVAIGAIQNHGNGDCSGHVRMYTKKTNATTSSWIKLGSDIDGEGVGDKSGVSVSFSQIIMALSASLYNIIGLIH